jgi:hypothetical protein
VDAVVPHGDAQEAVGVLGGVLGGAGDRLARDGGAGPVAVVEEAS